MPLKLEVLDSFGAYDTATLRAVAYASSGWAETPAEPLGALRRWHRVRGTPTIETPGVYGDGFLRCTGDGDYVAAGGNISGNGEHTNIRVGFRVRLPAAPPPGQLVRLLTLKANASWYVEVMAGLVPGGGQMILVVDIDSDGILHLNDNSGSYADLEWATPLTTDAPLPFGEWHYLEIAARWQHYHLAIQPPADDPGYDFPATPGWGVVYLDGTEIGGWATSPMVLDLGYGGGLSVPGARGPNNHGSLRLPNVTWGTVENWVQLGGPGAGWDDWPRGTYDTVVDYDDFYFASGNTASGVTYANHGDYRGAHSALDKWPYGDVHVAPVVPTGPGTPNAPQHPDWQPAGAATVWEALADTATTPTHNGDGSYVTCAEPLNPVMASSFFPTSETAMTHSAVAGLPGPPGPGALRAWAAQAFLTVRGVSGTAMQFPFIGLAEYGDPENGNGLAVTTAYFPGAKPADTENPSPAQGNALTAYTEIKYQVLHLRPAVEWEAVLLPRFDGMEIVVLAEPGQALGDNRMTKLALEVLIARDWTLTAAPGRRVYGALIGV